MAKVRVLVEGYVKRTEIGLVVSSTVVLIQDGDVNIIVDPGMDRERLLGALEDAGLKTGDIDYVILTHNHLDHILLAGIFENAAVLDRKDMYSWDGRMKSYKSALTLYDTQVIHTPGHDYQHCSAIVKTEEYGTVGICGDVLWWMGNQEQKTDRESILRQKDPFAYNREKLKESRLKLLDMCDYIIPGHGEMFKVEK